MLTFQLSDEALSERESERFSDWLDRCGADSSVWDVYRCLAGLSSGGTRPLVLRAYRDSVLAGAALVMQCRRFGATLFASPLHRRMIDGVGWHAFVWIRTGFCAETIANPGFAARGEDGTEMAAAMLRFLESRAPFVLVVDRKNQAALHPGLRPYPYPSDGTVEVSGMRDVNDYLAQHRNIRRKRQAFRARGGAIQVVRGPLDASTREQVRACLESTAPLGLIQAPFQDLFTDLAIATCRCASPAIVHVLARAQDGLLGYHSFVRSGRALHMMHGAFARDRATTHHAYENIMIESVRCALDLGLQEVRFGPVMNETKRRMVNACEESALYFHSRHRPLRLLFSLLHPFTRLNRAAFRRFAGVQPLPAHVPAGSTPAP